MAADLNPLTSHGNRAAALPPSSLPSFEHLFSGSPVVLAATDATDDTQAGAGDSAGRATNVKAPGGRDARNSRDGG